MTNSHPFDGEIQQYALDRSVCPPGLIEHIDSCPSCLQEVNHYQQLFTNLKQIPATRFDFDVSELVLPLLPSTEPLLSADRFIAGFLVIFISFCIGIPILMFSRNIINLFSGISPLFIYAILGSAALILVLKTLNLYKKYRTQMRQLNYS